MRTEEIQRGKVTWWRLHSNSGAELEKVSTADTKARASDASSVGCSRARRNIPPVCCNKLTWLWEKDSSLFCPKKHVVWSCSFPLIFSSPFLWSDTGLAGGEALRCRGVSLLFHYISESPAQGEWNTEQGHLTSSVAGPRTVSVTRWAQFWEVFLQYTPCPTTIS